MNPFRSRKKSHDGQDTTQRSSSEEIPALPPTSRARTFRRRKVQAEEAKVELDLSTALPSSDDFRTSLLMPNLSARFSMLRDQDDPTTKIGKANDDSVLFPKRVSRLNLFGHEGLSDIAEVTSLAGSIRPPFAYGRSASYASTDGYGTDDDLSQGGSVMSRSKPGQGNKFFGGRQKIYKIPMGTSATAKDVCTVDGHQNVPRRGMGKAVYDDDIAMSAFQALRAREKEELGELDEYSRVDNSARSSSDPRGSPPPSGYNRNRETSSSTASVPATTRISTAATSITSQSASPLHGPTHVKSDSPVNEVPGLRQFSPSGNGPERTATKSKRLYGQGLDKQMYEQQSSAVHRLESLQRQRGFVGTTFPTGVSQSRSATNLNDRYQRPGPLYASSQFRAASPPPSVNGANLGGFVHGLNEESTDAKNRGVDPGFGRLPPLSPPMSPNADVSAFAASLEPNDIGKATASGVFNKPRLQFNEHQYAQRQLKLQEGRETPPPRGPSRTESYSEESGRARNDSSASVQSSYGLKNPPLDSSLPDQSLGVVYEASSAGANPPPTDDYRHAEGTFLAGISGSEADSDYERGPSFEFPTLQPGTNESQSEAAVDSLQPLRPPSDQGSKLDDKKAGIPHLDLPNDSQLTPINIMHSGFSHAMPGDVSNTDDSIYGHDSPTLGPATPAGLNGLIRTHLRNESNQSSVYPSSLPAEPNQEPEPVKNNISTDSLISDAFIKRYDDEWNNIGNEVEDSTADQAEQTARDPLSQRAQQILKQARLLTDGSTKMQQTTTSRGYDKAQQILGGEAPRGSGNYPLATWQEQLNEHHHSRGDSSETQKEREDFASELADRRKRVQENLKNYADAGSRSSSPMPGNHGQDPSSNHPTGTFGLLKKASRGSIIGRNENASKAMKMLGIGASTPNSVPTHSSNITDEQSSPTNELPSAPLRTTDSSGPFSKSAAPSGSSFIGRSIGAERRNRFQNRQLMPSSMLREHSDSDHSAQPSPEPNGYFGKPRAELPHTAPLNGYQPSIQPSRKYSPPRPLDPANDRTLPPRSQSAMSSRSRSNSRSNATYSIDPRSLQPVYQNNYPAPFGRNPRASPIVPYASNPTSPLYDTSPAHSGLSTPTMGQSGAYPSQTRVLAARKRSVNKSEISDPTFINSTSSVTTVDLDSGASLRNGMTSPDLYKPPVPPLNPRRKGAPPQNVFAGPGNKMMRNDQPYSPHSPSPYHAQHNVQHNPNAARSIPTRTVTEPYDERNTFSADESQPSTRRRRLRKTSSEGGSMAARARHLALMDQSPAMPSTPVTGQAEDGSMF
ncbi:hypothetical protein MMC26_004969 [Xylographa opegraphella]|nr:hypothetical protein [Xylographa opegraphella]